MFFKLNKKGLLTLVGFFISVFLLFCSILAPHGHATHNQASVHSESSYQPGSEEKYQLFEKNEFASLFSERFFYQQAPPSTFSQNTANGEVTVYTTIRPEIQTQITSLFNRYAPLIAAGVVLDAQTGAVLAMGNYTRNGAGRELLPEGEDNYCLYGGFPAASLIKIITAAAALEKKGFSNDQTLPVSGRYHTLYKSQLGLEKSYYKPAPVSLEKAFAMSINPFFGKIGIEYVDDREFSQIAEAFLFNTPIEFDLPMSRSCIVKPLNDFERAEVASGYNTRTTISPLHAALIASLPVNEGKMMRPFVIERVVGANGQEVYSKKIKTVAQPLSSKSVEKLRELMQGTVQNGTARNSFAHLRRLQDWRNWVMGGKTGSIDLPLHRGRCDWFTGFGQDGDTRLAVSFILIHGANRTVRSSYLAAETLKGAFLKDTIADQPPPQSVRHSEKQSLKKSVKLSSKQTGKQSAKRYGKQTAKKVEKSRDHEAGG